MRPAPLDFESLHAVLRAAGEGTRLRILALLAEAELTVSDLTKILRQSQPRISRHLKLLAEAGLVDRYREGSWAFYRLGERGGVADIAQTLVGRLDPSDQIVMRDRGRLAAVRAARAAAAQTYFSQHAAEWDRIRRLHVTDAAVESCDPDRARRPADPLVPRSRHRHGAHARAVRAGDRARARHRYDARHACARARAARARRAEALQRAAGRHLRAAGAEGFLRRRRDPSGAALPR